MNYYVACSNCDLVWQKRGDFLDDANVKIIGYQASFMDLLSGLFLFNHSCQGTISLPVNIFEDLYAGPVFAERATDTEDCPGHCKNEDALEPCTTRCECAFVRNILQLLRKEA